MMRFTENIYRRQEGRPIQMTYTDNMKDDICRQHIQTTGTGRITYRDDSKDD